VTTAVRLVTSQATAAISTSPSRCPKSKTPAADNLVAGNTMSTVAAGIRVITLAGSSDVLASSR
jgi:hypothetical protein